MTVVIEADEAGRLTLPAALLGEAKPHGKYVVEFYGRKLFIGLERTSDRHQKTYEDWKQNWDELTEEISAVWDSDKSAAEIVSEMRR